MPINQSLPAGLKKKQTKKSASSASKTPPWQPGLERNEVAALGMNPQSIVAGYGQRGERIRHTVNIGALQMPRESLEMIHLSKTQMGLVPPKKYALPGLDSVVRPSQDVKLHELVVTEISLTKVQVQPKEPIVGPDGIARPAPMTFEYRTAAKNRTIVRPAVATGMAATDASTSASNMEPARIRGGGTDANQGGIPSNNPLSGAQQPQTTVPPSHPPQQLQQQQYQPQAQAQAQPKPAVAVGTVAVTSVQPAAHPIPAVAPPAQTAPVTMQTAPMPMPTPVTQQTSQRVATTTTPSNIAQVQAKPTATLSQTLPSTSTSSDVSAPAPSQSSTANPVAATSKPVQVTSQSETSSAALAKAQTVQNLKKRPAPQWEQQVPGANDEMVTPKSQMTPLPEWYAPNKISGIERAMVPEWFDASAAHRTPKSYLSARNKIIDMSDKLGNRYVTNAMVRRVVLGDAGSLHRLRNFLVSWGWVNEDGINDSTPTLANLRKNPPLKPQQPPTFDDHSRMDLMNAIVYQSKRRKTFDGTKDNSDTNIDWAEVASKVGKGITSAACEREFLSMSMQDLEKKETATPSRDDKEETTEKGSRTEQISISQVRECVVQDLLSEVDSGAVHLVTYSAAATLGDGTIKEHQNRAVLGVVANHALQHARSQEDAVASVLDELVNQRLKKLENRMALMDDVEGMLEAERVALELERRDFYTTRCRHWFDAD